MSRLPPSLTTEAVNPASVLIDELSPLEIVRLMNAEDAGVAAAVATQAEAIARVIEGVTERMRRGGRLVYIGAGTSGRLGVLDAAECPPTFSTPPELVVGLIAGGPTALVRAVEGAEDDPDLGRRDLDSIGLSAADAVMGIASSGRTPYVMGGLARGRELGALTIGLVCNGRAELTDLCDILIAPEVGPEIIAGSTRLKAGTATKLVLNMITTATMVQLGKTYGNLMVDLRATNSKLLVRTRRLVARLASVTEEEAERLLAACDGELKTAVVAQTRGVPPEEARTILFHAQGRLREALTGPAAGKNPADG